MKNAHECGHFLFGVADGARTHDNRNHNPGLYQLSYSHRKTLIITNEDQEAVLWAASATEFEGRFTLI